MSYKGMTEAEVNDIAKKIVDAQITKLEETRQAMGCHNDNGCLAGKEHFQMHENKINSDLNNFKTFIKTQELSNISSAREMQNASIGLNSIVNQLDNLLKNFERTLTDIKDDKTTHEDDHKTYENGINKKIFWFDVRQWGILVFILGMCLGTVWSVGPVKAKSLKEEIKETIEEVNKLELKKIKAVNKEIKKAGE